MKAIVATVSVIPGREEEFVNISKGLIDKVRANEPGCLFYALHKTDQPATYMMIERYTDGAAIETHMQSPYFKAAFPSMRELFAAPPTFSVVDEIY